MQIVLTLYRIRVKHMIKLSVLTRAPSWVPSTQYTFLAHPQQSSVNFGRDIFEHTRIEPLVAGNLPFPGNLL